MMRLVFLVLVVVIVWIGVVGLVVIGVWWVCDVGWGVVIDVVMFFVFGSRLF